MEQLWRSIREAETPGELLSLMDVLSRRTEALVLQRRLSDRDLVRLMRPLATLGLPVAIPRASPHEPLAMRCRLSGGRPTARYLTPDGTGLIGHPGAVRDSTEFGRW